MSDWGSRARIKELEAQVKQLEESGQELAEEYHAAIHEPMYAGTRKDWIDRAFRAEGMVASAENRFQLMLQEREFFAKQIRDIRGIFRAWATVQRGDERFAEAMNTVLDRPNPMGS